MEEVLFSQIDFLCRVYSSHLSRLSCTIIEMSSTTILSDFLGAAETEVPSSKKAKVETASGSPIAQSTQRPDYRNHIPPRKRKTGENGFVWHVSDGITLHNEYVPESPQIHNRINPTLRYAITWTCIFDLIQNDDATEWTLRCSIVSHVNRMLDLLHSSTHYTDYLYPVYAAWAIVRSVAAGTRINFWAFGEVYKRFTGTGLDMSHMKLMSPLLDYIFAVFIEACQREVQRYAKLEPTPDRLTSTGTLMALAASLLDTKTHSDNLLEECRTTVMMLVKGITVSGMLWSRYKHLSRLVGLLESNEYGDWEIRLRLIKLISPESR